MAASTWPRASATRRCPAPVENEAIAAILAGHNIYTRLDGIARLRKAIADKQQRDYGLRYDPETRSAGRVRSDGGIARGGMALLNPGDEVLVFEPFYGYHVSTLKSMRVKPVSGSAGRAGLGA